MKVFLIFTAVINLVAMVAVIVAANRAHKKDQEDYIKRDRGPL
jgi:hypothetical protein